MAKEHDLDLVEVGSIANPPVCKILDFGKYLYQIEKKTRKQRAGQKKVDIKGIRLSLKIGKHDLDVRKNQTLKFLEEGHKVRLDLILRGREKARQSLARDLINEFVNNLGKQIAWEQPIKSMNGNLSGIITKT